MVRTDSTVSWWTGSARFRGEPPPARLLAWREVRRVRVDARRVPLAEMAAGVTGIRAEEFDDILAMWLSRSPLTDLATAARTNPAFAWSASTLSLVATPAGHGLAMRALARIAESAGVDVVLGVLTRAAQQVPPALEEARRLAEGVAASVKELLAPEEKSAERA